MYFTQEDLLKIERYLKLNSKKDTDFPISTDALSNLDLLVFIKDNSNKRVAFQKVLEAALTYVTNTVYTKSEVYNKTEVYTQSETLEAITGAIRDLGVLGFEVLPNQSAMDSLLSKCNNQSDTDYPDYGINATKYTYLIPNSTTSGNNRYDEYIILRHGGQAGTPYSFTSENIGVRSIDLADYVKKEKGKGLSTNDFNNAYKLRLDALNPNSISKEIYYNSCIKELNITDPNYKPPRDSSDPEGAYEGDKYYLVTLYKGKGNSSGASIIITKNGTNATTDTVCQLWVSKSNYDTNPNTNSPFVNIPEKFTDNVGSGVNAKALIVWNNVFYNNRFAAASLAYGSYGPYEIPVTCVNNNANDSYLRNSITKLGEYNIELDRIHKKDTEILLQKFEGYKGEYYRKSGHDSSLMIDVSDSTFKSHPIKIQLYPIPDEEYTLKLILYPGTPYNPGTALGEVSIDSDNYIVNYTINNRSCNTIKILKDVFTNVDEAIIYTYDTSSLNERMHTIGNSKGLSIGARAVKSEIPNYWFATVESTDPLYNALGYNTYLDNKIDSVPDGKHFIFITDVHYSYQAHCRSAAILDYVRRRLGIKTIIHGGDVENENADMALAAKQWLDFNDDFVLRIGGDFKLICGDHDHNGRYANSDPALNQAFPYTFVQKMMNDYNINELHYDTLYDERIATYGWSTADMSEYDAWKKMHYYYDDSTIKTRFIVLHTGWTGDVGLAVDKIGLNALNESQSTYLQMDFLYQALMTTPNGYNIVVCGHNVIGNKEYEVDGNKRYSLTEPVWKGSWQLIAKMLRAFNSKQVSPPITYRDWSSSSTLSKTYDFTNAPSAGFAFCIGGDVHWDILAKSQTSSETLANVSNGSHINKNSDILHVITMTDSSDRGYRSYPDGELICPLRVEGTIDEQAFDIVTMTDNAIYFTRIGANEDRVVYLD